MLNNHDQFRALAARAVLSPTGHEQMAIVQEVNSLAEGEPILALLDCIRDDAMRLGAEQLKRATIVEGLRTRIAEPFRVENRKHIALARSSSSFSHYNRILRDIDEVSTEQRVSLKLITRPYELRGLDGKNIVFHLLPKLERAGFFTDPHFFHLCKRGALCFAQFLP